ncbi:MAG: chromosome segregation protein SMC [Mogibacterium sp.]|nr:chromosome segregation protein SMC [Mogibacterium sp.]
MYFKRIELQGFKSFADPVTIELNDGVTCIIGPNGSGKSNISDALRWVLGEQSSKQLRGSKMQDVIFAGTNTRKPKGMAEVTLVIDNSTGMLPLEYTEVAVTRRMYRSGESEYLINGNQCRLRDIKELFMDTGIGVDGYSIIGQGKIAEIVSSKPESRRQIFEEAAGIVMYKSRKTDAENKLKTTSDNLERIRDIIFEIEGRIGGLKEDSEKASEFIALRDRYKTLGINIILHNLEGLDKSVRDSKNELEETHQRINTLTAELKELEELIDKKNAEESELNDKYSKALEERLEKIEELNDISSSGQINEEKLNAIEKELERLNASITEKEAKLEAERKSLAEQEEKNKELSDELNRLNLELEDAVANYATENAEYNRISAEIESGKDEIVRLTAQNGNKEADIRILENYIETLRDKAEQIRESNSDKAALEAELKGALDEKTAEFEKLEQKLVLIEEDIDKYDDKIISVNNSILDCTKQINENTNNRNRAESRMNTIEEMEHNYEGYNNAVRSIMQKSFGGIIGTVSDIISVPDRYTLAVETALGNSLQNIVCKDDASAKSAVEWLKSAKAGRATFLPMSSIKAEAIPVDRRIKDNKGYIGIASELVDYDDKYKNVIEYLLCRVIIADSMDNAVAISKGNINGFKVVSLDGEVINSFGAITGGKYANKTANFLDRKKEISELKDKITVLEKLISDKVDERNNLQEELLTAKQKQQELNTEHKDKEIEYNVVKAEKEIASEQYLEVVNSAGTALAEIETINSDIKETEERINSQKDEIKEASEKIDKLQVEIEELLDRQQELKDAGEENNEAITDLRMSVSQIETKIASQADLTAIINDNIYEIEDSLQFEIDSRAENEENRNHLTSSGVESEETLATLRKEKEELDKYIEDLQSSIDTNKIENDTANRSMKSKNNDLNKARDDYYRIDVKTARNEAMLDAQKEKLWDEFEVSYAEALDMRDPDFAITAGNRESKEIKLRIAELGDVNIGAIEEYKAVSSKYEFLTENEADTRKAKEELEDIIANMDKTIKVQFKKTFDEVVVNFEQSFKELFGGGYAELTLEDESNPLESGIEITAQPPGKKLKNINLLSGGEKTLTAIALMFAVLKAKPTPFCILDEVEAALDEVNIERFSDYLKNFKDIQFALITHQKATMEHADILYGVTMPEQGVSRMLSLKLGDEFDIQGIE